VKKYPVGGIIFMGGDWETQRRWIAQLRAVATEPLIMMQDAEWGLNMHLKEVSPFPKALTLGAVGDFDLLVEAGRAMGRECACIGIDMNLSPVCDLSMHRGNRVIGMRAFGSVDEKVARCVAALIQGMREEGVLSCAKHFPGHGGTVIDSHLALPFITESLEIAPFQAAISARVNVVMVGHLCYSHWDPVLPASLSKVAIESVLRDILGFEGVVISDSLCMDAISKSWSLQGAAKKALMAGCDLILFTHFRREKIDEIFVAFPSILEEIAKTIKESDMLKKQERIAKLWKFSPRKTTCGDEESIKRLLFRSALTEVGDVSAVDYWLEITDPMIQRDLLLQSVDEYRQMGMKVGYVLFCSPYLLQEYPEMVALVAYEDNVWTREAVRDYCEGRLLALGKLPIRVLKEKRVKQYERGWIFNTRPE